MNRDDIIRMARETASIRTIQANGDVLYAFYDDALERFAALVAAAERDECARLADKEAERMNEPFGYMLADRIRMRGAP